MPAARSSSPPPSPTSARWCCGCATPATGLNDNEVAAALEPFRTSAPSDQASGVSLSLTKALVEANRAQFHIKAAGRSGTLIEVVFSRALARA